MAFWSSFEIVLSGEGGKKHQDRRREWLLQLSTRSSAKSLQSQARLKGISKEGKGSRTKKPSRSAETSQTTLSWFIVLKKKREAERAGALATAPGRVDRGSTGGAVARPFVPETGVSNDPPVWSSGECPLKQDGIRRKAIDRTDPASKKNAMTGGKKLNKRNQAGREKKRGTPGGARRGPVARIAPRKTCKRQREIQKGGKNPPTLGCGRGLSRNHRESVSQRAEENWGGRYLTRGGGGMQNHLHLNQNGTRLKTL